MNIKRAKQEIKNSIEAYLAKNKYGDYVIPSIRQRPMLLMGPPGIGKTQIMEQIARECEIGLVAYTITHHTRQSAVGLPFIREKEYGGKTFSVTEYTMSEIIASVYEKIEVTGKKEGILFIDEINCVSETLAPTMLQFLQNKTFGNQKVPEGWIIVAAGNPPEYNKSVREFDVVTLDRMKRIDVEANLEVWKEYAYEVGIHPAILAYLEIKKDCFYKMETTVDGKAFVTARGWEDLSEFMYAYELSGNRLDREVVYQYLQHSSIAKDFANYYELYKKYKEDYQIQGILQGEINQEAVGRLKLAPFDERLSVVELLYGKVSEMIKDCYYKDQYVTEVFSWLKQLKSKGSISEVIRLFQESYQQKQKAEQLSKVQAYVLLDVQATLEGYDRLVRENHLEGKEAFDAIQNEFQKEVAKRQEMIDHTGEALTYGFEFLEVAFGDSQEMVIFVTELNMNYYSVWFIKENGCDKYYQYNRGLLFEEQREAILEQMKGMS